MKKKDKSNLIVKTMRYEIIKPLEPFSDWKDFRSVVKKLQSQVREASNKVMTACNLYYCEKKEYGKNYADKTIEDKYGKILRSALYSIASANCEDLYSSNVNIISENIYKRYFTGDNSYEKNINRGESNPPMCFKENIPIPLRAQNTKIEKTENGYYNIKIPLFSKKYKNKINLKKQTVKLALEVKKQQKSILDKIIVNKYKLCDSKLVVTTNKQNKNVMCFDLTYSFKKPEFELDKEKVCGVDLGIAVPAYAAVNFNNYSRFRICDSSIIDEKIKHEKIRKKLQAKLTYGTSGNSGHGRKTKINEIQNYKTYISNINLTKNYQWANKLVQWAVKMNCGKIRMEDLSGYNNSNSKDKFLKYWTYYDLQSKIKSKANYYGIEIEMVNPSFTSQKCSKCGYTDKNNRPKEIRGQAYFKCLMCGHEENADFNAAKNIANSNKIKK